MPPSGLQDVCDATGETWRRGRFAQRHQPRVEPTAVDGASHRPSHEARRSSAWRSAAGPSFPDGSYRAGSPFQVRTLLPDGAMITSSLTCWLL